MNIIINMIQCSEQELNNAKYRDKIPIKCTICGCIFYRYKRHIMHAIRDNRTVCLCSRSCQAISSRTGTIQNCMNCGSFIYSLKTIKKKFCSQSCAATYNNTHKTHGYRRSKLEQYIKQQLKRDFPNLNIIFNNVDVINLELDIYIPDLRIAFELNGIFHYEPIYGHDTLIRSQQRDKQKLIECYKKGIELVVIDTSKQKNFKESTSIPFYKIIKDIIVLNLGRLSFSPEVDISI